MSSGAVIRVWILQQWVFDLRVVSLEARVPHSAEEKDHIDVLLGGCLDKEV